jgi:hypothetical protein
MEKYLDEIFIYCGSDCENVLMINVPADYEYKKYATPIQAEMNSIGRIFHGRRSSQKLQYNHFNIYNNIILSFFLSLI